MLINLLPDFLAILDSTDRIAAYRSYFDSHHRLLQAYWHNYVIDPDSPHFADVVRSTVMAERDDLRTMLDRADVVSLVRDTEARCRELFETDVDYDVVLMVGVGAANAGELVVGSRGVAFVCLEHFTGIANPDTQGLGLDPELIPLWLAHEIAHVVRYTSPASRSEMRAAILENGGDYSYWETGRRVALRELLINEGLAVHASQQVSPGHAAWEYFGYARRQYARVRELEGVLHRTVAADLERSGLGLRLRYLSGGMSEEARTVDRYVIPERSGYYLGSRIADTAVRTRGLAWSLRASATDIMALASDAGAVASA